MDWKDRVPTYPNRKKITYEGGRVEYVTIEYADEPVEGGTPLNKNTFDGFFEQLSPVVGTYVGNYSEQEINLGFKPSAVFISRSDTLLTSKDTIMLTEYCTYDDLSITDNGFLVAARSAYINESNAKYHFVAWR